MVARETSNLEAVGSSPTWSAFCLITLKFSPPIQKIDDIHYQVLFAILFLFHQIHT